MTPSAAATLTVTCPGCDIETTHPVTLLDGQLVGPITTLRVRSIGGEANLRAVVLACPECGLVSMYDAEWVRQKIGAR